MSSPGAGSGTRNTVRLLVFAGLPGTGKSTLAFRLAQRIGAVLLSVDPIEEAILSAGMDRSFATGLAAYVVARELARTELELGHDVVLDAVNGVEPARKMWEEVARMSGARRHVIEVTCPDAVEHRRRVEGRTSSRSHVPPPSWADVVAREYLPWHEPRLTVDATRPVDVCLEEVVRYCGVDLSSGSVRRPHK